MDEKYDPGKIESKWQEYWETEKLFKVEADSGQEKYYLLEMFPYPSGKIHGRQNPEGGNQGADGDDQSGSKMHFFAYPVPSEQHDA